MKKYKRGFSLVELLLTLGIIAAIAITAFIVYPKINASSNAKKETENINYIKASIKSLYTSINSYEGLNDQVAIDAGIFPPTMIDSTGTKAINSFKDDVTITTSTQSNSGKAWSAFVITYNSVPISECVKIVSSVASGFYRVTVNDAVVKLEGYLGDNTSFTPETLNMTKLTEECEKWNGRSKIVLTSL